MNEFLNIPMLPILVTIAGYWIGTLCQKKWKSPILNPILIGMLMVVIFLLSTGMDTTVYKAGTDKLSWLMTPATISLAIPLYEQFQILRKDLKAIAICGGKDGVIKCSFPPCGVCRQVMREFCDDDFQVLLVGENGFEMVTLAQLLPHSFRADAHMNG